MTWRVENTADLKSKSFICFTITPLSRTILWPGADSLVTPPPLLFIHYMPGLPLSSPDQSFKSVKVSKFNTRVASVWLTCAQGEHLHVLELQRGVGWVQSLTVVCHVHVCQCLLDKQILNYLTVEQKDLSKKLMCPSSPPPPPSLLTPSHTSANLPPSFWGLTPPSDKVAPGSSWVWWGPTGVREETSVWQQSSFPLVLLARGEVECLSGWWLTSPLNGESQAFFFKR